MVESQSNLGVSPSRTLHNRSQVLICKNQLSAKSKSNHQMIKENMIAQNTRNLSQQNIRMGPFYDQSSASGKGKSQAHRSVNNASNLSRRLNYTGSQLGESQPVLREVHAKGDFATSKHDHFARSRVAHEEASQSALEEGRDKSGELSSRN